jgi:hypothetical protein
MTSRVLKLVVLLCAALVAIVGFSRPAVAQQVTYYTFDSAPGNYSYSCTDPAQAEEEEAGPVNNPLLCFNDGTGSAGVNPSLSSDSCGSADSHCPYTGSGTHTTILMTPGASDQRATVWFSVPQKVLNGFTSYFAFRLTPCGSATVCTGGASTGDGTADGITFMLQNASGYAGSGSGISGSGPNIIGPAGGSMGYSGIDNSLAVEFDTFDNSELDDPNNNHIAVQS